MVLKFLAKFRQRRLVFNKKNNEVERVNFNPLTLKVVNIF